MTERIRNMAKEAMYGEDKFPRCSISVENESELSSPKAIAEGLRRYSENTGRSIAGTDPTPCFIGVGRTLFWILIRF